VGGENVRDAGAREGSNGGAPPVTRTLSPREAEILELLCRGLTAPQVAGQLGLSSGSVKNKRRAVYQKLHVTELAQACAVSRERAAARQ
jgi:DNA-binding NarL/FixJ family response regulator